MPGCVPRCFETQNWLTLLAVYVIPHSNSGVRRILRTGHIHKETNSIYMLRRWLEMFSPRWNQNEAVQATKIFASVQDRKLPKEVSYHWGSGVWTVHRNRSLSRRYIRNVYCAQKQNTFHVVLQKYVLWTERKHFPGGTS